MLPPIEPATALALVAAAFAVPAELLSAATTTGRRRKGAGSVIRARQAAAWLLRVRPKPGTGKQRSFPEIGRALGIDHSSALYAWRRAEAIAAREPAFAAVLAGLSAEAPALLGTIDPAVRGASRAEEDRLDREARKAAIEAALQQAATTGRERNRLSQDDGDAAMRAAGSLALAAALRREMAVAG